MDDVNDYELQHFIDDPNFDQFINLIRGENIGGDTIYNFDFGHINSSLVDNDNPILSCSGNYKVPFDECNNINDAVSVYDPSCFDGEVKGEGVEENDVVDSSGTTTTNTSANSKLPRPKNDRSKTLVSERRRRVRMKESLYALRSLVPNITKMDKASIIGDAVSYVHELQAQAKKLKAEVAGLESSLLVSENCQGSIQNPIKVQFTNKNLPFCKKIIQMDIIQVDERGFYVKVVCNKGEGVAASLYKSLESLAGFNVQNSNLATVSDTFLLTFSLNIVQVYEPEINLLNLKLWLTRAFLNQGFEFIPSFKI